MLLGKEENIVKGILHKRIQPLLAKLVVFFS
jgi:hypothetical protein